METLCLSVRKQKHLIWPSESMQLGIIKIYNRTAQPKCSNLCNAFYGRQFREPWKAGCAQKKGSIPTLL